jgi:hypothetical protein
MKGVAMKKRLGILGLVLIVAGFAFVIAGGVAYAKVQDGYDSLQAFSAKENVQVTYDENGHLVDRGSTEEADAIMSDLTEGWKYPVVKSDFDPNDPLVNTASEYMYQMATIVHHVTNGTQTVVLDEPVTTDDGTTYAAGTYEFPVDGRYWTAFDRSNPIEAAAREQAWSGTVHGLVAELGVGTVTHSTLQMGLALAGLFAGVGLVFMLAGGGLIWAGKGKLVVVPDTVPEAFHPEPVVPTTELTKV